MIEKYNVRHITAADVIEEPIETQKDKKIAKENYWEIKAVAKEIVKEHLLCEICRDVI